MVSVVVSSLRQQVRSFGRGHVTAFGLVRTAGIVVAYLGGGALVYIYALDEPWTLVDTLYFSMATMSTVRTAGCRSGG